MMIFENLIYSSQQLNEKQMIKENNFLNINLKEKCPFCECFSDQPEDHFDYCYDSFFIRYHSFQLCKYCKLYYPHDKHNCNQDITNSYKPAVFNFTNLNVNWQCFEKLIKLKLQHRREMMIQHGLLDAYGEPTKKSIYLL